MPSPTTTTSTAPAARAGTMAVIIVALSTATLVAATPPKVTVEPPRKLVPVIVTGVPPCVGPLDGCTEETRGVGGAGGVAMGPVHGVPVLPWPPK